MTHTVTVYINGLIPSSSPGIDTIVLICDPRLNHSDPKRVLLKDVSDKDGVIQGEIDSQFIGKEVELYVRHLCFKNFEINIIVEDYGLFHSVQIEKDYVEQNCQDLEIWRSWNSNKQYALAQREIHKLIRALRTPLDLMRFSGRKLSDNEVIEIVWMIVNRFKDIVEKQGLAKLFWDKDQILHESKPQGLFFAVADSYCEANDIDLSPEVNSGSGAVDFKLSNGYRNRVLVELKLSTNTKLVHGYKTQLEIYKDAEKSHYGIYLIIDVGNLGNKLTKFEQIRQERIKLGNRASDIVVVDGQLKPSASKR